MTYLVCSVWSRLAVGVEWLADVYDWLFYWFPLVVLRVVHQGQSQLRQIRCAFVFWDVESAQPSCWSLRFFSIGWLESCFWWVASWFAGVACWFAGVATQPWRPLSWVLTWFFSSVAYPATFWPGPFAKPWKPTSCLLFLSSQPLSTSLWIPFRLPSLFWGSREWLVTWLCGRGWGVVQWVWDRWCSRGGGRAVGRKCGRWTWVRFRFTFRPNWTGTSLRRQLFPIFRF